jgi:Protein of unknown function (DUF1425)
VQATGPAVSQSAIELEFWSSIKNSNDPEDFKEYLSRYPNGQFASIANRRLAAPSHAATRSTSETVGAAPPPRPSAVATTAAVAPAAAPAAAAPAPAPTAGPAPTIASKIEELGKMTYLRISDMRAAKRDNLLRIQFEVTNTSHENQQLYYRFKWLDNDGFSVWNDEPWKPLVVYGNQKQTVNVVSPSFKATDFRLVLQSPKNEATSGRADSFPR